jgi:hypothetical protein
MNNVRSACHTLQNAGNANSLHRLKVVVKWNIFYFTPAFQKALMLKASIFWSAYKLLPALFEFWCMFTLYTIMVLSHTPELAR